MKIREITIRHVFVFGVLIKAFDGAVELLLGIALLFAPWLTHLIDAIIRGELAEDPADLLAHFAQQYLPTIAGQGAFLAIYVGAHGLVKLFLAAALLRNKLWAYPVAMVVFGSFAAYQLMHPSFYMYVLTALDIIVIALTWHEWRFMRRSRSGLAN